MDIPNITLEDIERELDRRRKNKFFAMFPGSGPYRRELYVPHMEFIEATKTHSECAFLAGNRCLVPSTYMDDGRTVLEHMTDSFTPVKSYKEGEELDCVGEGWFFKGYFSAYRVVLHDGRYFDVSGGHRILFEDGYHDIEWLACYSTVQLVRLKELELFRDNPCIGDIGREIGLTCSGIKLYNVDNFNQSIRFVSHPSLVGGAKLKYLIPLGIQPIVDFTVLETHNYKLAGVYHHNTGKSETVTYCATAWLTGLYPDWWNGRVFDRRVDILIAGENAKLVRDSIQMKLMGPPNDMGTGMIPFENIYEKKSKSGVPDALDTVTIRHKDGGFSRLVFGSYDQGREAFQATEYDVVIFDEEPPIAIYTEGLMRTMTRNGLVLIAATPLKGMTELMLEFQKAREDRE